MFAHALTIASLILASGALVVPDEYHGSVGAAGSGNGSLHYSPRWHGSHGGGHGSTWGGPGQTTGGSQDGSCNTGSISCCNSVADTSAGLASLLGFAMQGTQVGIKCSSASIEGTASGSSCSSQPVCCSGNTWTGLVNIGCSPININL
ncbi:fungal hydrophobin [Coniophora puteana RWD-64-598 SS2]|uniref:Hydrophobin n=1 Tax=Coniophora puteana (strain RWD-64-598) TaxID=741705 RepID=A0A5M3MFQ9_CONPW|nr:fungal hydrophobin [Coniophora puteana RWD-64-598 SS2]EIW78099.1 fungal hydrophobin [Coniophora puteana RWD-64-598 SS2]